MADCKREDPRLSFTSRRPAYRAYRISTLNRIEFSHELLAEDDDAAFALMKKLPVGSYELWDGSRKVARVG